jgi:hypothetical protein
MFVAEANPQLGALRSEVMDETRPGFAVRIAEASQRGVLVSLPKHRPWAMACA